MLFEGCSINSALLCALFGKLSFKGAALMLFMGRRESPNDAGRKLFGFALLKAQLSALMKPSRLKHGISKALN